MNNFLKRRGSDDLDVILTSLNKYFTLDRQLVDKSIREQFDYMNSKASRSNNNAIKILEDKWYLSLKNNSPDYSVYSDPYYFCDLWYCWKYFSSKSVGAIIQNNGLGDGKTILSSLGPIRKVLDLGSGFAYTTAALKDIFPFAKIVGTNIQDTWQFSFSRELGKKNGFDIESDLSSIGPVDLVFASEYFEHIDRPIEHLAEVLKFLRPKYLLIANGFNGTAIGHFNSYNYFDKTFSASETSKNFNKALRFFKYNKIETKIWNNRPSLWKRVI